MREAPALSTTRGWSAWATAFGGLAAGLVVVVSMATGKGAPIDIAWPGAGGMTVGLLAMPSTTTWALALAASLGLYVAGLFAPLGAKVLDDVRTRDAR